ncbi:hypothetical protein H0H93_013119 [Arthromyces matolae]|nr:hypothetical protein H0H93_013119 [Arthromyces matolae]
MARIKIDETSSVQAVHTQLKNMDPERLQALVALLTAPPANDNQSTQSIDQTPTFSSPNKRKPDDGCEVIAPSTPSPKKSRSDSAIESPVIRALEVPVLRWRVRNPSLRAKEASEAADAATPVRATRKNTLAGKTGTSDAKAVAPLNFEETPKRRITRNRPGKTGPVAAPLDVPIELTDSEDELPPAPKMPPRNVVRKPRIFSPPTVSFIDDAASDAATNPVADGDSDKDDAGSLVDFIVSDSEPIVYDNGTDDDADGDVQVPGGTAAVNSPPADPAIYEEEDDEPAVDPTTYTVDESIIRSDLHDPLLAETYAFIPLLNRAYYFEPYGYDRTHFNGNDSNITVTMAGQVMSDDNFTSLYYGLTFVRRGFYVNLARFPTSQLVGDGKRLAIRDEGAFLTGIMCGLVTASNLFEPVVAGSLNNQYHQKRLTLALFPQERILDMSRMVEGLGLTSNPKGTYSSLGLSFITRPEGKGAVYVSSHAGGGYGVPATRPQPPPSSGLITYSAAPMTAGTNFTSPHNLSLNYEDIVPIYDGRAETAIEPGDRPFRFTDADFDALGTWRMFRRNRHEIPLESVVTVGYTVHWFEHSGVRYINTNIKFVIVLHTPNLVVGLDSVPRGPKVVDQGVGTSKKAQGEGTSKKAQGEGTSKKAANNIAGLAESNKGKGKARA